MKATTPILFSLLWCAALCAQNAPKARPVDPSMAPVEEVANLPRVLLIGDSISMGYTVPVRELLKDKANVLRVLENAGDSARGIVKLDAWLGAEKWDVIHFNFGLHDLKYLDETGKYVSPDQGKQVASLTQYEANLRQIVERLKKTGAKLIWASTTPVPEGTLGRVKSDEVKYNETALRVMKEYGIEIDDLHTVVTDGPADMQLPKNVHFTKDGYQALARSVAAGIETALSKR